MEQTGIILLKTNIAIVIFAAFYWLLLRKLTFYHINRIYLLFTVIFSLLYPFIEISNISARQLNVIPEMMPVIVSHTGSIFSGLEYIIAGIWMAGSVFFLLRLGTQLYSLYGIHRQSSPSEAGKNIRIIKNEISPFSFGSYIYINPAIHSADELQAIMLHEQVHVRQKHSIDILLTEFLLLINWFNPFTWLLRKSIKENIEFITDDQVLKQGIARKDYQYHLLNTTCISSDLRLQNSFTIADLKKRIMQMNMKPSAARKLLLYSLIPLLSGTLLLFNQPPDKNIATATDETMISGKKEIVLQLKESSVPVNANDDKEKIPPPPPPREANTQIKVVKGVRIPSPNEEQSEGAQENTHKPISQNNTGDEIIVVGYPVEKQQ